MATMTNKQQLLMHSLTQFFETNNDSFNQFHEIIKPNSKISLRVIDWFITNYSRVNDINYPHPRNSHSTFAVHDSYKSQLKAYSKRQFDPFCRRMRINFYFKPTEKVTTTVGQLNFFRWAIENGVMKYITDNFVTIEKHMKNYVRENRERKKMKNIPVKNNEYKSHTLKAGGGYSSYNNTNNNNTNNNNKHNKHLHETKTAISSVSTLTVNNNIKNINQSKIIKQNTPLTVFFH